MELDIIGRCLLVRPKDDRLAFEVDKPAKMKNRNSKQDILIAAILGAVLTGILLFDGQNKIISNVLVGFGFGFFAWLSFWSNKKEFKQPLSGIFTFIRIIIDGITEMVVIAASLCCGILPFFALLGLLGEWLFGETGAIIGCIIGLIIGFPIALKIMHFIKTRFLEERLESKDLEQLKQIHERNRLSFLQGKNYYFPLTLILLGPIFILMFFWVYADDPDHETFLFLPLGIFLFLFGFMISSLPELAHSKHFFHKNQKADIRLSLIACIVISFLITALIGWVGPAYSIARLFEN